MKKFVFLCFAAAIALSACKKEEPTPVPDTTPKTVTVGQYFASATATPSALTGTAMGGATMTAADKFGTANNAWNLDGVDDYLEIADAESLKPAALTIAAYVQVAETRSRNGIIFKSNGQSVYDISYGFFAKSDGYFAGVASRGSIEPVPSALSAYTLDEWYHAAVTCDKDSVILYINGVKQEAKATGFELLHAQTPLLIGRYPYFDTYFKGKIADFRFYGAALTAAQVADLLP